MSTTKSPPSYYTEPQPPASGEGEMAFLDHLEELRWRIMKGLAGVLIGTIICSFYADWVIDTLLMGPTRTSFFMYKVLGINAVELVLQNRTLTGQFFAYWGTVLIVGIITGVPIFLYQIWAFVKPGLFPGEQKGMRFSAFFATFFFLLGLSFGYLILTPLAVQFFAQFSISEVIINEFDISRYFSMVVTWAFGAGLLFEMPVVVYFLAKMGVITPTILRNSRKYALIIILIVAAFLTPPDPLSQIIMAIPLLLLYETSIWIATRVHKKKEKAKRKAAADEAEEEAKANTDDLQA